MVLTEDTFLVFAMNHYQVPSCPTLDEFEKDLRLLTTLKRMLSKGGERLNTNLALNIIITWFNCFGDAALKLLFFSVNKEHWGTMATFLLYINRMPEEIPEYGIRLSELKLNEKVIEELRKI